MLLYNSLIQITYNQRQWDGLRELRAKNNGNSIIQFPFRVAPVLVAICFIYYIYRAHDLYKIYICIINTVLKMNQLIFITIIVYYIIPHQSARYYKIGDYTRLYQQVLVIILFALYQQPTFLFINSFNIVYKQLQVLKNIHAFTTLY